MKFEQIWNEQYCAVADNRTELFTIGVVQADTIEFTDIIIDDQLVAIATTGIGAQTGGEAARTVGRTARAAAIGGSSGARTGARVGAGASILTSGASIQVPAGTILERTLAQPLTVQR